MERPDIDKIQVGLDRGLQKQPDNPILKDAFALCVYAHHLELQIVKLEALVLELETRA